VEFERSLVKKYKQCVSESADVLVVALASSRAIETQIEGKLELYKEYTEQLKENKELNKVIETQGAINALKGILELDKKERNPNRVAGGKRGRPPASKSKAVGFGAEAMPDHDLVPFGTRAEKWQQH
jgi:hypothetical protein